jgi:hypothetical protein
MYIVAACSSPQSLAQSLEERANDDVGVFCFFKGGTDTTMKTVDSIT